MSRLKRVRPELKPNVDIESAAISIQFHLVSGLSTLPIMVGGSVKTLMIKRHDRYVDVWCVGLTHAARALSDYIAGVGEYEESEYQVKWQISEEMNVRWTLLNTRVV